MPTRAARAAVLAAVLLMVALGIATMVLVALETGAAGFAVGLFLALLPLPVYLGLALWIDRYEKEPLAMLGLSLLWGATVAGFLSYVFNTLFGRLFVELTGERGWVWNVALSAPIVEETAKGAALFLLFFWKRDEFDNLTDWILYAAIVGLGFGATENVLYYGKAFAQGVEGSAATFLLRGVLTPYSHPLFTVMTGAGLGIAREEGGRGAWVWPGVGLALAIVLHAAWNLSAALGVAFFFTYLFVMVPFFFGVIALIGWSLRREREILRVHLVPYAAAGVLTAAELERLTSPGVRLRERLAGVRAAGFGGWRRAGAFHHAACELAFHAWRQSRGLLRGGAASDAGEREALERLRAARAEWPPVAEATSARDGS